ncbi:hypothetical protein [Diplocloster hominis]|uniref:hypothetical protein n=1 Tax=Diplocloster hominis TaxID=3079010 RepID=UPI0031B9BEBB
MELAGAWSLQGHEVCRADEKCRFAEFIEFVKKYFSNTKVYDMMIYSILKRSERIPAE